MSSNKQETIDLNKALVIRGPSGDIRRVKSRLELSEEDHTLVEIIKPKKANSDFHARQSVCAPTARGYGLLASRCGLAYDSPDTVIVNGVAQANPCWTDSKTCYARKRIGGYTALGQPVIIDRTVEYSVHGYNVQDLLAKAGLCEYSTNKNAPPVLIYADFFQILPFVGEIEPGVYKGEPDEGNWAGYRVDDAMVLWVRTTGNPHLAKWLGEMNNRKKTALRTVQTFAERNAIAAHPALPPKLTFGFSKGEEIRATVECVSWFATSGNITFDLIESHKGVEIVKQSESVDYDRDAKTIDAVVDPVDPEDHMDKDIDHSGQTSEPSDNTSQDERAFRTEIGEACDFVMDSMKSDEIANAFAAAGVNIVRDIRMLSTDDLKKLHSALQEN